MSPSAPDSWPYVPGDLVDYLEASYPPRCKGVDESLEAHARYAGAVELIATLRARVSSPRAIHDDDLDALSVAAALNPSRNH